MHPLTMQEAPSPPQTPRSSIDDAFLRQSTTGSKQTVPVNFIWLAQNIQLEGSAKTELINLTGPIAVAQQIHLISRWFSHVEPAARAQRKGSTQRIVPSQLKATHHVRWILQCHLHHSKCAGIQLQSSGALHLCDGIVSCDSHGHKIVALLKCHPSSSNPPGLCSLPEI